MRLLLLAVGRLRPAFRAACDDYLRRLARLAPVDEREVREAGRAGNAIAQREAEGKRLLEAIADGAEVVLLDPGGRAWSSETLAANLERWRADGRDRVFVIGGALGVSEAVRARADRTWSLGPLTLPHELARVVVVEQLYRAATILRGMPYHKGAR
jgi:23S rRNA (pseudouridine1915-N3)-methyltransferase